MTSRSVRNRRTTPLTSPSRPEHRRAGGRDPWRRPPRRPIVRRSGADRSARRAREGRRRPSPVPLDQPLPVAASGAERLGGRPAPASASMWRSTLASRNGSSSIVVAAGGQRLGRVSDRVAACVRRSAGRAAGPRARAQPMSGVMVANSSSVCRATDPRPTAPGAGLRRDRLPPHCGPARSGRPPVGRRGRRGRAAAGSPRRAVEATGRRAEVTAQARHVALQRSAVAPAVLVRPQRRRRLIDADRVGRAQARRPSVARRFGPRTSTSLPPTSSCSGPNTRTSRLSGVGASHTSS